MFSKLREQARAARAEAAKLEGELDELRLSARIATLQAKRIPDRLHAEVQTQGGKQAIRAGLGSLATDEVVAAVLELQVELIERFGDRLIDFVEATKHEGTAAEARAHALREQATALDAQLDALESEHVTAEPANPAP